MHAEHICRFTCFLVPLTFFFIYVVIYKLFISENMLSTITIILDGIYLSPPNEKSGQKFAFCRSFYQKFKIFNI